MFKFFKKLLDRISVALGVEFHENVVASLQEPVSRVPLLASVWNKYKLKVDALSAAFKRARKYMQTAELVSLDESRDGLTKRIIDTVKGAAAHPVDDAEKAAAVELMPIVDNYLAGAKLDYE